LRHIDLKLDCHHSKTTSAKDIIDGLDDFESLSLDFGRLSVVANGISQGEVKDVAIEIGRLSDLTLDDFEFIQQCHLVHLKILHTPQEADESRLVHTIQHNPSIIELHIGCNAKRSPAVIKLVISTKEKIVQRGGQSALRVVKVMNSDETSSDNKGFGEIAVFTVSFSGETSAFDVESHIKL
jgi:hypothetical protein